MLKVKVLINHWYWVQAQHMLASTRAFKGAKIFGTQRMSLGTNFYLFIEKRKNADGWGEGP